MSIIKKVARHFLAEPMQLLRGVEKGLVAQCQMSARLNRKINVISNLAEVEFRAFSQWGEDGIIDWLIEKLPGIPETFVEFGVENYRESNTRMLLWLRNWRGLVIDGSKDNIADVKRQDVSWKFDLSSICAFIDKDNINALISMAEFRDEIGLLSVDIDGNDYWVWKGIEVINPVIVVCEYNAVFGDLHKITIPYQADFQRTEAHFSNLYFGASLPALIDLGVTKGYAFVGTNSNGCNAFFVRNDRAQEILNSIGRVTSYSSRFRESRERSGALTYLTGMERLNQIKHLPVVDLERTSVKTIGDMGALYSEEWRSKMRR